MTATQGLAVGATWFIFGQTRMVLVASLSDHRVGTVNGGPAEIANLATLAHGTTAADYDTRGGQLLPWYRIVNVSYWSLVATVLVWAVIRFL